MLLQRCCRFVPRRRLVRSLQSCLGIALLGSREPWPCFCAQSVRFVVALASLLIGVRSGPLAATDVRGRKTRHPACFPMFLRPSCLRSLVLSLRKSGCGIEQSSGALFSLGAPWVEALVFAPIVTSLVRSPTGHRPVTRRARGSRSPRPLATPSCCTCVAAAALGTLVCSRSRVRARRADVLRVRVYARCSRGWRCPVRARRGVGADAPMLIVSLACSPWSAASLGAARSRPGCAPGKRRSAAR